MSGGESKFPLKGILVIWTAILIIVLITATLVWMALRWTPIDLTWTETLLCLLILKVVYAFLKWEM